MTEVILAPGAITILRVTATLITKTKEQPLPTCYEGHQEPKLKMYRHYSRSNCMSECALNLVYRHCDCTPVRYVLCSVHHLQRLRLL